MYVDFIFLVPFSSGYPLLTFVLLSFALGSKPIFLGLVKLTFQPIIPYDIISSGSSRRERLTVWYFCHAHTCDGV